MNQTPFGPITGLGSADASVSRTPGLCVLCVDDEPQVLEGLRLQLHRYHEVLAAGSGAEGLEILHRDQRIATIISDMRMPAMDGSTFLRQARELAPDVPRILLTGQADMASAMAAVNQGQIFGFLIKPCPPTTLIAAVTAAVGRYRLTSAQRLLLRRMQQDDAAPEQPDRALGELFARACELFGCRYAALVLQETVDWPWQRVLLHGLDAAMLEPAGGECPLIGDLTRCNEALHLQSGPDAEPLRGLPAQHPPITQLLGVPLATAARRFGWIYFADNRRCGSFGPDDAQAAAAIATACVNICERTQARGLAQRQAAELLSERTSRDHAELRAHHLLRSHTLLRSVISTLNGISGRDELFDEVCRAAVTIGGFQQAWIGLFEGQVLAPVAWRGADDCFVARMCTALLAAPAKGPDSAAAALLQGRTLVCNEVSVESAHFDCRELAPEYGFRSLAALPLSVQGRCIGALFVHAPETGWFNAAEMALMTALTAEMSQTLELIEREHQLEYLAHHDPLTRLPNRRLFLQRVDELLKAARTGCGTLYVMTLDLERFKYLNDSLGQDAGDEVLRQVAARLQRNSAGNDQVARIDGDCFALAVAVSGAGDDAIEALLRRTLDAVELPLTIGTETVHVSARLGVARFPGDGDDADRLLRNAEAAMKSAKAAGDRIGSYTAQLGEANAGRIRLEEQLRRAIAGRRFQLHYQPVLDLRLGTISGAEALLRLDGSEFGMVSPAQFVPVLEATGMILEVGRWVLRQAMADIRCWLDAGLRVPPIAVNVSALQFKQPDFVDWLQQAMRSAPECAGRVALEITESTVMSDTAETIRKLHCVRDMGIPIAVDDFGTGYSSLAYLARLPVSTVKIDRSFVVGLKQNGGTMVSGIIALTRALGLRVIAEGVDSTAQLEILRQLQCDEAQGFLFSPALSADGFAALLCEGGCPSVSGLSKGLAGTEMECGGGMAT